MFGLGFSKVASYDYKEHMADLLATEHKHVASKSSSDKVSPKVILARMAPLVSAIAASPLEDVKPPPRPEDPSQKPTPSDIESRKISYMGNEERKSFYRGLVSGLGL